MSTWSASRCLAARRFDLRSRTATATLPAAHWQPPPPPPAAAAAAANAPQEAWPSLSSIASQTASQPNNETLTKSTSPFETASGGYPQRTQTQHISAASAFDTGDVLDVSNFGSLDAFTVPRSTFAFEPQRTAAGGDSGGALRHAFDEVGVGGMNETYASRHSQPSSTHYFDSLQQHFPHHVHQQQPQQPRSLTAPFSDFSETRAPDKRVQSPFGWSAAFGEHAIPASSGGGGVQAATHGGAVSGGLSRPTAVRATNSIAFEDAFFGSSALNHTASQATTARAGATGAPAQVGFSSAFGDYSMPSTSAFHTNAYGLLPPQQQMHRAQQQQQHVRQSHNDHRLQFNTGAAHFGYPEQQYGGGIGGTSAVSAESSKSGASGDNFPAYLLGAGGVSAFDHMLGDQSSHQRKQLQPQSHQQQQQQHLAQNASHNLRSATQFGGYSVFGSSDGLHGAAAFGGGLPPQHQLQHQQPSQHQQRQGNLLQFHGTQQQRQGRDAGHQSDAQDAAFDDSFLSSIFN
mmetsp:Transcript_9380/g.24856  ORF Transcript_9380/g.24856 Transcript_9380/m.24856 type:complete len:516 (+) Transcript_9380:3306-4853(+)